MISNNAETYCVKNRHRFAVCFDCCSLRLCLKQHDAMNMTVLHAAAASRASGFARFFMQQLRSRSALRRQRQAFQHHHEAPADNEQVLRLLNISMDAIVNRSSQVRTFSTLVCNEQSYHKHIGRDNLCADINWNGCCCTNLRARIR